MAKPAAVLIVSVSALAPALWAQGPATAPFFDDVPSNKPYYHHVNLMRIRFITQAVRSFRRGTARKASNTVT